MKTLVLTFMTILPTVFAAGQTPTELQQIADDIVSKAKLIYDLESAAWIANDTIFAKSDFDKGNIESYVSYKMTDKTKCIFYSRADTVLAEFIFTDSYPIQIIFDKRPCNQDELRIIKIKRTISDKIAKKGIKRFKVASETTYNLVPIFIGNDNFCYLINTVADSSKTILGKDWKITLDANFNITETIYNHKSILVMPFHIKEIESFFHTHILSDYFFETELATTMLYKKYLPTDQFMVIGKKYTSVWDSTTMTLTIK